LDPGAGCWQRYDASEESALLDRARAGELTLFNYYQAAVEPRLRANTPAPDQVLAATSASLKNIVAALARGDHAKVEEIARAAAFRLTGVPLASVTTLTTFVGFHAFELAGKKQPDAARTLLQAGLEILPEDPTLAAALGEIELRAGRADAGRAHLERALARDA